MRGHPALVSQGPASGGGRARDPHCHTPGLTPARPFGALKRTPGHGWHRWQLLTQNTSPTDTGTRTCHGAGS